MPKAKSTTKLLCFLIVLLSINTRSGATGTMTSGSDYYVHFSWSGISTYGFTCYWDYANVYVGTTIGSGNYYSGSATLPSGSVTIPIGPNITHTYSCRIDQRGRQTNTIGNCSPTLPDYHFDDWDSAAHTGLAATTDAIHPPIYGSWNIVNSTIIPGAHFAHITWAKGSDIPDSNLVYNIYRNGIFVATVADTVRDFLDTTLLPTSTYIYQVTTKADRWGNPESTSTDFNTYISNNLLHATDASLYGKSQLTWPNIATYAPNNITVMRNGLQLSVVDKNTTTYNDFDGVPGIIYDYSVAPINANNQTPFAFHDNGASRPNGQIKGNVRTPLQASVSGVTLYAYATVDGNPMILDSTVTDASGFYQFNDLFYDTSAVYTIVPHKGVHHFNPDTLTRTLAINNNIVSGVDFQDTSVFTIQGQIRFAADPHCPNCYDAGVEILQNGASINQYTNATGNFSLAIQTEGTYIFKPRLYNHTFSPDSIVINVIGDASGVNFTDLARDTIFVTTKGGCNNTVSFKDIVSINADNGSYAAFDTFSGYGQTAVVVPAQPYTVNYMKGYSNAVFEDPLLYTALGSSPISLDVTKRDTQTLTHIDTTYNTVPASTVTLVGGQVITIPAHTDTIIDTTTSAILLQHRADFVYHGQITVDVLNFPLSTACPSVNGGYIMDQGDNVPLRVSITEFYTYDSTSCPVDSGQLLIYDDVSDRNQQTVNFYNGRYDYMVSPGVPNIAAPYLKVLQFFAHVGNITAPTWGQQVLVTGHRPHTQTFVTKTPELPFFVLHDPPGGASYSFLAKDSSVSYNYSNSYQVGGSAGPYVDAKIGAGISIIGTSIIIGAGTEIQADAQAGRDNNHNTSVTTTFTATQQFSTSNSTDFVGSSGDVFVGGSFNMIYALTDVIELKNCQVVRDTQLAWGANGLATNYIYTEKQISKTIIPQLQLLKSLSQGDTVAQIQSYIDVWNQVLSKNRRNRDTAATFTQNISFSAGAPYDNSATNTSDSTESYDYSVFLNVDAGLGAVFGALNSFAITSAGAKVNFHWNMNSSNSTNVNMSKTIGYHLEDGNVGDFMSVDVKKDAVYGTPSFKIVAGTTSCPHEAGTQARDSADITLDNYSVSNVPITQSANFVAHIVNLSESQETRTYQVQAVPQSNLDGAIIKIGGQQINNAPANFTIPAGTDLPVVLTVDPGPIASDYNALQVSVSSPCDGGEGSTVTFEAHFQSTCSPIGLYTPSDNWLINAGNHDSLLVIFSGYNVNNPDLINIGLEYQQPGGTWIPATNPPIAKSALTGPYYNFVFNTASLPDGDYAIRAYANCGSQPGGRTNSATLNGKIDRSSLQLFGTPSPSDGVLNVTQNISVSFNGAVDCAQAAVYTPIFSQLVRNDNGQVIPDSVTCNGNRLIIYTNPPSLIDSLENVSLTCTINNVYDMNGNTLQQPITWSFIVNRSKVFWSPSNMNISTTTGTTASATATMLNTGPLDTFTIVHMPSWLSTPQAARYIVNQGTPANPSSLSVPFTVQNSLNPGHYTDTVIAMANGRRIFLFVNLDVVKPHPNWSVNPANYLYSMNVTTNFSLTQLNAPLSTDTRDTIAVFKGNECRGYAGISYDPYSNQYVAFITAYSNSQVGDTFTFRIWDAVPGTEYQAKERLAFIDNGTIGQPLAPYILHPEGVFQTIPFTQGWNWFSLSDRSADMSISNVLQSIHPNNNSLVKTDNTYAQYAASSGWQGSLSSFTISKSYMLYQDHADTLHVLGAAVIDTTTLQIASGWNWIGYPRQDISPVRTYLSNTNVVNGDLLKTQTTFTQYNNSNWSGTLNNMYPGQGYKLKTTNAFNIVVPPTRSLPAWNADDNTFQQNQTVTADLRFDGVSTTQSHYLIGAFANGVCIGVGQPVFLTSLNLYRVFLTIHGDTANASQNITLKVYDTDNDIEYIPTYDRLSVLPDTSVASVAVPYVVNVQTTTGINAINYTEGYSLLQNVPNPFAQNTTIAFTLPKSQQVTIQIYDESGRLVKEVVNGVQAAGTHTVSFAPEELQPGVYLYQMRAGDFVKTRRMLILK